jgi:hypothetical protein
MEPAKETVTALDMFASLIYMGTLAVLIEGGLTCTGFNTGSPWLQHIPEVKCFGGVHIGLAACAMVGIWVFSSLAVTRPLFQSVTQAEVIFTFDFLFLVYMCQTFLVMAIFLTSETWVQLVCSIVANVSFVFAFGHLKPCSICHINRIGVAAFIFSTCVSMVGHLEQPCYLLVFNCLSLEGVVVVQSFR